MGQITRSINANGSIAGLTINGNFNLSGSSEVSLNETLPAADTGTISAGAITVTSNGGTPNSVAGTNGVVSWTDANGVVHHRYGCTFTVAGSVVTVTLGTGATLPSSGTVYCINATTYSYTGWDGTKLQGLLMTCPQNCSVQFETSVPAVLLDIDIAAGTVYEFHGGTSPIAGTVAIISAGNGSGTAAALTMGALLQ